MSSIVSVFLLLLSFALLPSASAPVTAGALETLEFDASADCYPEADVNGPEALSVLFRPTTSRIEAAGFTASLSVSGELIQEAAGHRWDFPEEGWHSVFFEGPTITARFFCQESAPTKNLYISYQPEQDVKISLSQNQSLATSELDSMYSNVKKSLVTVIPNGNDAFYSAGRGTQSPYWLTFSAPVHSSHDINTTVKYEFP